jgi:type IV secretion system protein VirB5
MTSIHSPFSSHSTRRTSVSLVVWAVSMACAFGSPVALADWAVTDKTTQDKIDKTNEKLDEANKNLSSIDKRFNLGTYNAPGDRVGDDQMKQTWPATLPQVDSGIDQCDKYVGPQQGTCKELVKTRNADYLYMKTMYDTSNTRNDVLKKLVQARQNLGASDYGKLEDNTNQIMALRTLIALDNQQLQTVHNGYQARIEYLNRQLSQQADAATGGKGSSAAASALGSLAGAAIGGGILAAALNGSKSDMPSGMKRLSVDR